MTTPKPCAKTFTADLLSMQIALGRRSWVDGLNREALISALSEWKFWARPDQIPPPGNEWTTWLVLGGRGAGKTRTGAEWLAAQVRAGARRLAVVGETYEDAREVMIDGPSGLSSIGHPNARPIYESSRHRLVWPNGAEAHVFSADDPDGLRGFQFEAAWSDEIFKWRCAEDAWNNLQLGLRLGQRPRQVVTTTPAPQSLLKRLLASDKTVITRSTTYDNQGNLANTFFSEIASVYEGTALGRQELMGELIEDKAGALWSWEMIEAHRETSQDVFDRVVVAVDPPVSQGPDADECGIVVVGAATRGGQRHGFVLADRSVQGVAPTVWASRAAAAYHEFEADRIVVEVNQGGDLVTQLMVTVDPSVAVKPVRATRGKAVRAEPIAALYEQGKVHHVAPLPVLEEQLTTFTGAQGEKSPDRLDALVWGLTEILLGSSGGSPSVRLL